MKLDQHEIPETYRELVEGLAYEKFFGNPSSGEETNLSNVPSSLPLLCTALDKSMILAGPGYGKSTITQFVALYHAARIVRPALAAELVERMCIPEGWTAAHLESLCELRFPFRIELRRYAKWRKTSSDQGEHVGIAAYIAKALIGGVVESDLTSDDIFSLIGSNPTLVILDGLDEVPNKPDRDDILKDFDSFLHRCAGENVDLQLVMSSRPQGYNGEFDRFQPLRWTINDLHPAEFESYCTDWLSQRIRSVDERNEANERIARGLKSEAVQNLATTLLQATVMLTIVKRKSDIPNQRHKLFERYVDVVFEREKGKSELIANYERELRLLHETVGYQLHCAAGQGTASTLPEVAFRTLVLNAWSYVHGNEHFAGILNQEVQRLIDLATDRLVFLTGKGKAQTDIDFVIQQYREYFAALYLSKHVDADPDRVFISLVVRGAYWQQVLRFFAALANPAQQKLWVHESTICAYKSDDIDTSVNALRIKRAVLFVLPEFERMSFEYVNRIVERLLPEDELWTWIHQDWAVSIISTCRAGMIGRLLWNRFDSQVIRNRRSISFALWIFPRTINRNCDEFEGFQTFVGSLLTDEAFSERAATAALQCSMDVDYSAANEDTLCRAMSKLAYETNERSFLQRVKSRIPKPAVLRMLCTRHTPFNSADPKILWQQIGLPLLVWQEDERSEHNGSEFVAPFWMRVICEKNSPFRWSDMDGVVCIYEEYLCALLNAVRDPFSPEIHRNVRKLEKALPEQPLATLSSERLLGIAPSVFANDDEWLRDRKQLFSTFTRDGKLVPVKVLAESVGSPEHTEECDLSDCVLLFPPEQWDLLVTHGLVEAATVEKMRSQVWIQHCSLLEQWHTMNVRMASSSFQRMGGDEFLLKLLGCAIEIHNAGTLYDADALDSVLNYPIGKSQVASRCARLMSEVSHANHFPPSWARVLVELTLGDEGCDFPALLEFWRRLHDGREEMVWLGDFEFRGVVDVVAIVRTLLNIEGDCALHLAISLSIIYSEVPNEVSTLLNSRIAKSIRHGVTLIPHHRFPAALTQSHPSIDEAELYADFSVCEKLYEENAIVRWRLPHRLLSMPQAVPRIYLGRLRDAISAVVRRGDYFPPEAIAAGVDALIQIDTTMQSVLEERDWIQVEA